MSTHPHYSYEGIKLSEELDEFLKRVRKIERKVREYIEEEMREALGSIREEYHSIDSLLNPSWTCEGHLRPLYTIKDLGNAYVIYIDLPKADLSTIDVRFKDNLMIIRARLKEEFTIGRWSSRGSEVRFCEYREVINLPIKVDPNKVKVTTRGDRVQVIIDKE